MSGLSDWAPWAVAVRFGECVARSNEAGVVVATAFESSRHPGTFNWWVALDMRTGTGTGAMGKGLASLEAAKAACDAALQAAAPIVGEA